MKYSVMVQVPLGVRVDGVEAESQEQALKIAEKYIRDNSDTFSDTFKSYKAESFDTETGFRFYELAEDAPMCAFVDEQGDSNYLNSTWYAVNKYGGWVKSI